MFKYMKKIPKNIKLETERLVLQPVWEADPSDIAENANDFTVANFMGRNFPYPYKKKDALEFLETSKTNWNKKNKGWNFGIFKKENKEFLGCVTILPHQDDNIIGNLGYWLGRKYWENGYASEAVEKIVDYSFKELGVRKISAGAFSVNKASQKVLLKNNFKIEGIQKKQKILRNGKIVDLVIFGKLNRSKK